MNEYIGIDFHKQTSYITRMDGEGNILEQLRVRNKPEELGVFLANHVNGSRIAIEATGNWYYFYELIEDLNPDVCLSHPQKTRAIASARIKTDKIDSTTIAHLLRSDLLPTAYIPSRDMRDTKEILRYRASLVSLRTNIKNKVRAILSKNGIVLSYSNVFGKNSISYLKSSDLRPCYRCATDGYIRLAEALNLLIDEVSQIIKEMVEKSPRAMLLTTIPGISYYSALLILAEIGDINRFPDARHLCSYSGLVPSTYQSADRTRHGRITKQGSRWLRWILVELTYHAIEGSPKFKSLYLRIAKKHGKNTARVAVARQMLKVIFYMLKHNEPFMDS
jgi:transposase